MPGSPVTTTIGPGASLLGSLLSHTTCPPEERRQAEQTEAGRESGEAPSPPEDAAANAPLSGDEHCLLGPTEPSPSPSASSPLSGRVENDTDSDNSRDTPSPATVVSDRKSDKSNDSQAAPTIAPTITRHAIPSPLSSPAISAPKPVPRYTSSYLRDGSKFVGTQQSDRQVYKVEVEIKHVDMTESFVCGYLRIEGLTADHPSLTTYFEGEVIGNKYAFQTKHAEWQASEKIDMQHWARFPAWRPLAKAARKPDFTYKNYAERENLFMRWKEYFLVPDHRVKTIVGASFEGFYYICFNQVLGTVSGVYFHARSEKYQQLELKHVDDRGCMGAVEFR